MVKDNITHLMFFTYCFSFVYFVTHILDNWHLKKKNRNFQYLTNVEKVFISSQNITVY